jgi:uncharacterized protein YodC (DUF2158 family)
MSTFTNRISIAAALMLGIALSMPLTVPAFSDSVPSAMPNQTNAPFRAGERVRMRSGGPMMIVDGLRGSRVDCYWMDMNGVPNSESFSATVLQKF